MRTRFLKSVITLLVSMIASLVNQIGPLTGVIWLLIVFFVIGSIIIWFVGAFIFFIPAIVAADIMYFITGNNSLAGLAFLLVALSSLTQPRRR